MTLAHEPMRGSSTPRSVVDRHLQKALLKKLNGLQGGCISIIDGDTRPTIGQRGDLSVALTVNRPRFYRRAALGGALAVAASYADGDWDCDDLPRLIRILVRNVDASGRLDSGFARLSRFAHRRYHLWRANTRSRSRKNIHAHYDLGNDFFRLWLDDTWAYSSGIFSFEGDSLREASVEKFDRVCRKLNLKPHDHLLEIGCGWGGLAIHAAEKYGCRVTGTTISKEQLTIAQQRVEEAGLQDRVSLVLQDYRDLTGQYDKLASIEMIEAVGHQFLDRYFQRCASLLRPHGSFVLQAIVMPEQRYARYLRSVDFIQRYIFPGGCLPSCAAILNSAGAGTDFKMVHTEEFGLHYAETLRHWRHRFHSRIDDVRALGYSESFVRMWDYYLAYCEATFEERYVGVVQMQFDKPGCRRDPLSLSSAAGVRRSEASFAGHSSRSAAIREGS